MRVLRRLLLCLLLTTSGSGNAAEVFVLDNTFSGIGIQGPIEEGDYDRVLEALYDLRAARPNDDHSWWKISINSPGGDVQEAIRIGEFVRKNMMFVMVHHSFDRNPDTGIWDLGGTGVVQDAEFFDDQGNMIYRMEDTHEMRRDGICHSACALILFASTSPEALADRLGVHRPRYQEAEFRQLSFEDAEREYQKLDAYVRSYLTRMGVSTELIDLMFATPSDKMLLLNNIDHGHLFGAPAYQEWLKAKCPDPFTQEEKSDFEEIRSTFRPNFSRGYIEYLDKKNHDEIDCWRRVKREARREGEELIRHHHRRKGQ
jgi:hypothetical protein